MEYIVPMRNLNKSLEKSIVNSICEYYYDIFSEKGYTHENSIKESETNSSKLCEGINFCYESNLKKIIQIIPTIEKVIGKNRKIIISAVTIILCYAYNLSEPSDDAIPDMFYTLQEIIGKKYADFAYDYIIYISHHECENCRKIRRFFLFDDL